MKGKVTLNNGYYCLKSESGSIQTPCFKSENALYLWMKGNKYKRVGIKEYSK